MIMLVSGFGRTFFCHQLFKATGRHQLFSFNDGVDGAMLSLILEKRSKIPHPVIILTGPEDLMEEAEELFRKQNTGEPVIRLMLEEPVL